MDGQREKRMDRWTDREETYCFTMTSFNSDTITQDQQHCFLLRHVLQKQGTVCWMWHKPCEKNREKKTTRLSWDWDSPFENIFWWLPHVVDSERSASGRSIMMINYTSMELTGPWSKCSQICQIFGLKVFISGQIALLSESFKRQNSIAALCLLVQ